MSIRWSQVNKWSLVYVDFGIPKHHIEDLCFDKITYGVNLGSEFSYLHMAIIVSNIKDETIAVVPLTTYSKGDENFQTNIVINDKDYGHMVQHQTTIKINHLRFIDKRKRVKKLIKPFISNSLKIIIRDRLSQIFDLKN